MALRTRSRFAAVLASAAFVAVTVILLIAYAVVAQSDRLLYPERHSLVGSAGRYGYLTPADCGLAYQDVTMATEEGWVLRGWYAPVRSPVPRRAGRALLMIHGHKENRVSMLQLARFYADLGFSLLLFDLRHHGDSGGREFTMGVREWRDAARAAGWLRDRGFEPRRMAVYGVSMGAMIAIKTQAEAAPFGAVVADCPSSDMRATIEDYGHSYYAMPGLFLRLAISLAERGAGIDLDEIACGRIVSKVRCPLLLIHGEDDRRIPAEHSRLLASRAGGPVETLFVPGAGHAQCFDKATGLYERTIAAFLEKSLP
ncbi:MAG: alpha/beta fold hydrolase [Candidatus Wallbacteria bacterium]|nr:alpha/beta fold hydrolase [Candidatus Wallbacteria bacterium]